MDQVDLLPPIQAVYPIEYCALVFKNREKVSDFEKVDNVRQIAREMHVAFEKGKDRQSFHNVHHIEAVEVATNLLLEKIDYSDPFGLKAALASWNSKKPLNERLSQVDMELGIKLAVSTHDLGNIVDTLGFTDSGFTPRFNRGYRSQGAEERSKQIVQTLLMGSGVSREKINKLLPFVQYLIDETKFNFLDSKTGFACFMRTVDQIGNGLFNTTDFATNLLYEMYGENPDATFVPKSHFNFARQRFSVLVPSQETRDGILKIWNRELPEEKQDYANTNTKIADYLATYINPN